MADPSKKPARPKRKPTNEQIWVQEFVQFYGTDNVTRFFRADLNGVSLTRAVEALLSGDMVSSEKCDGPGCQCIFRHRNDDDLVEVEVFFNSGLMELEITPTRTIVEEQGSEPNAA